MSTHRRLRKTMRSPVRQARRDTPHKRARAEAIGRETLVLDPASGDVGARIRSVRQMLVLTPRKFLDEIFKGPDR